MRVYKVNYINNRFLSVRPADHIELQDDYRYEASKEFIMIAFVKANSAIEAEKIGIELRDKFLRSKA